MEQQNHSPEAPRHEEQLPAEQNAQAQLSEPAPAGEGAPETQPPEQRQFRGLYRHVRISVRTLNIVIVVGIAVLVGCILWAVRNGGYHVTFDSRGGTDVAYQEAMYGDLVTEPEAPTREGYTFSGWYEDEECTILWDFDSAIVEGDMTLYAGWVPGT